MPVLRTFGGCGKFAILTDRRSSFSGDISLSFERFEAVEVDLRVGIFGVDAEWLALGMGRGLVIFEGVRRASLEGVGDADGSRDESKAVDGVRIFDIGN